MNWSTRSIREASRNGDYGRVVRLARTDARLSQRQLGDASGLSQSAISRLESRGAASYDMAVLARVASHLRIPLGIVGLAERVQVSGPMERRNFLTAAAATAAAPVISSIAPDRHTDDSQTAPVRMATTAYRRLDGVTPARQLIEPVRAHLQLVQNLAQGEEDDRQRARLAAAGSEAASLAGWLSWDMGDLGSARTWYGTSITAARRAGDHLLTAYQIGSMAQLEAHTGNGAQALALVTTARRQLDSPMAVADAWLLTIEALAHAAIGAAAAADRALNAAGDATDHLADEAPPPWPWVFPFNQAKVAAARLSCGVRLGLTEWISTAQDATDPVLTSGHEKQRALLLLDIAHGHLAAGRLDGAFAMARTALETGLRYRSGRTVERARTLRRAYKSRTPPRVVREFDELLHDAHL
ncbi:helix-turn-helix domain-containing protein [Streptomyces hainanensis]|uniref:XRE family transcriptional regulator n=1 Tax=Streptomyces hainanensis TaxID=402648 RepID=A0A4R4SMC8_9ACTN|nr:helix-turn-helix transcriptional regulator [Streptomyces hainanensis]TDC64878.1 XRE family transcriptional regulator [Streptomyces hainanensis]